ncbi:MAG: branched-chain amino acid ABC transporter permease [Acidimicrobiales bacterium]
MKAAITRARLRLAAELAGPLALVGLVALVGANLSVAQQSNAVSVLVDATIVVGLYVFIGNSGVMSFGQISFVAVGAFAAGIYTSPPGLRRTTMPTLYGFLSAARLTNIESLLLAAAVGGLFALLVGLALMRLSGLAAAIATFAVLEITYNLLYFWDKIGPGATTLSNVPVTTGIGQGAIGCAVAVIVAFAYQRTRSCRQLRASRADPLAARGVGVSIFRHRLVAFVISGAVCGFAGGLFVHSLGSINASQVYLDLTFFTLAMLVVGGAQSLWGATLGGTLLGVLYAFLVNAESGTTVLGLHFTLPNGLSTILFGLLLAGALILAPSGLARGREFLAVTLRERTPVAPRTPADEGALEPQKTAPGRAPEPQKTAPGRAPEPPGTLAVADGSPEAAG